jgi:hypothetical protein
VADYAHPMKMWTFENGQLVEMSNAETAFTTYRIMNKEGLSAQPSKTYISFTFRITGFSADYTEAEVYWENYCGLLCEEGLTARIRRNRQGNWEIMSEETLWIS